jgi:hypothetical protein
VIHLPYARNAASSHQVRTTRNGEVKNQIEFKEMNYGNEAARQQTSEGEREPLQAHPQRQTPGTRAHLALLEKPTSLI